jgi:hypothetical protein
MSSRTRVKHEISFGQRLANEAQRAREMAVTLPPGKKRDALLEKARLADLAARINGWLASPELKELLRCGLSLHGQRAGPTLLRHGSLHGEPRGCHPSLEHRFEDYDR